MIVYDDLEPMTKINICERVAAHQQRSPKASIKCFTIIGPCDILAPRLATTEALESVVVRHFLDSIEENRSPQTDGLSGLRLVRNA
jgi:hypothetical protein